MSTSTDETIVVEAAESDAPKKSAFPLALVVGAACAGLLLFGGLLGTFVYLQQTKAAKADVVALRNELKKRTAAADELKAQVEALTAQMEKMKEDAERRAAEESLKAAEAKAAEALAEPPEVATPPVKAGAAPKTAKERKPAPPVEKAAAVAPAASPAAKGRKSASEAQNCELVGKSAEEQAATLKRCVSLIDPPAKGGSAR